MYPLKQNTTLDVVFFVHDENGDAVLGIVDGSWTKRMSKNGQSFGDMTVSITERETGWYHFQISSAHTDTLGILTITLLAAGSKRVNLQFRVHTNILDDLVSNAAVPEPAPGTPLATPTLRELMAYLYAATVNRLETTSSLLTIHQNSGTPIAKAALSDDGTTFIRTQMVAP